MSSNWTHRVVKMSRGSNGEFFAHPGKAFDSFDAACDYARRFHAEQQASLGMSGGHKYCVLPRRADGESKTFHLYVPAADYAAELVNA